MKISKTQLKKIISEEILHENISSMTIEQLLICAQKLCGILPFECVASIQYVKISNNTQGDHFHSWQFEHSFDENDLAEPIYWNGEEVDSVKVRIHKCVFINSGKAPTNLDDFTEFLIVFDKEGEEDFQLGGKFLCSSNQNRIRFDKQWFIKQCECNSFDELDEMMKKEALNIIEYDGAEVKKSVVDDFDLDENFLRTATNCNESVDADIVAIVTKRYAIQKKMLEGLIPQLKLLCELLPFETKFVIRYVFDDMQSHDKLSTALARFTAGGDEHEIFMGLSCCLAVCHPDCDDGQSDFVSIHAHSHVSGGNPTQVVITNFETGEVEFRSNGTEWIRDNSLASSFNELDVELQSAVIGYMSEFGVSLKSNAIGDFNLDESKFRKIVKQILDENDEQDDFICPDDHTRRQQLELLRQKETELRGFLPVIQKVCDLLPITCIPEIHYGFNYRRDISFKTLDELFDFCEENNRDLYDISITANAVIKNSTIQNQNLFSFYSRFFEQYDGKLFDCDLFTERTISINWLMKQSQAQNYNELDHWLKLCVDAAIDVGNAEIRQDFDLNVDLD